MVAVLELVACINLNPSKHKQDRFCLRYRKKAKVYAGFYGININFWTAYVPNRLVYRRSYAISRRRNYGDVITKLQLAVAKKKKMGLDHCKWKPIALCTRWLKINDINIFPDRIGIIALKQASSIITNNAEKSKKLMYWM